MEEIRKERIKGTKLKRLRESLDISQKELSDLSEVPVRTIQQYEQRQKDINRASAETVLRLSRALCTTMEDLLEK
jgi:transcriptional regulator with XRE-family HTH domain